MDVVGIIAEYDPFHAGHAFHLRETRRQVGECAAEVREKRPPGPYKGKGIKYTDEVIRRKAGKTGAKK